MQPPASAPATPAYLPLWAKLTYSLGDHTVNIALSATSFFYLIFLTDHAGLRPGLAGLVVWVARAVDAASDPAMGRLSDLTNWRGERRRPYFLLGAVPFGVFFALMWTGSPFDGQTAKFFYYSGAYVLMSLAMTVLSVPYLALIPEMATTYDARTSLNTFRSAGSVLGALAAVAMKPLADELGGDAAAWATSAAIAAVWLVVPWWPVHAVSFERPDYRRQTRGRFIEGARIAMRQHSYRILVAFFILSRISIDLIGVLFLLYFKVYIGRESDFAPTIALFLCTSVLALPFWLRIASRHDKGTIFVVGSTWWIVAQGFIYFIRPEWPREMVFLVAAFAAIGYATCDLMPWSMLGDVIDEDELVTGERREGLFVGFFTFLRKLGGATGVLFVGLVLEVLGYVSGAGGAAQSDRTVEGIRFLMSFGPAFFLVGAVLVALRYPLTRAAHRDIVARLEQRRAKG